MRPILAVDPGLASGFAYYHPAGAWDGWERSYQPEALYEEFSYYDVGLLLIEDYDPRNPKSNHREALKVCGIAELWAASRDITFTYQRPVEVKAQITNDLLKAHQIYKPGKPHANDATRHILWFLINKMGQKQWLMPLRREL